MTKKRSRQVAETTSPGSQPRGKRPATAEGGKATQSARFTPKQMEEIKEACEIKGWSMAKLLERAAVEKAIAICNVERRAPYKFQALADDFVNKCLCGGRLMFEDHGRSAPVRETDSLWGQKPREGNWGKAQWSMEVAVPDALAYLSEDGQTVWLRDENAVREGGVIDEISLDLKIEIDRPSKEDMVKLLQHAGSELWPLLQRALDKIGARDREAELLDPQTLLASDEK